MRCGDQHFRRALWPDGDKLGLIPATISPYVVARIGEANALRTFTSARLFDAEEGRRIGLLHDVVEAERLDAAVEAEIKPYFSTAPAAVAASKRLVHALGASIDEAVIDMTLTRLADTWETPEAAEGIAAFLRNEHQHGREGTKSLNQKAAGRGENGDFRVPERSVLNVHEHRNAEKRHLQTGMAAFGTDSLTLGGADFRCSCGYLALAIESRKCILITS
ncbi:enoyl-CoA hydratase [Brucella melitensis bv. 1 str. 16M]|uniref:Enoyl-CoA hydratase n=1 Tax=Brucella melitensis biotype 1 (strain ATCC 23456 / CCUG 17765 / NCTC 10094 / 16M) TaxID=224914 RepID=Q8YEF0_BRUME|nr:enoyl-CoA hydratase [Brucella melitensis bv. 1 str. 16M]EEW88204.1 enoyl-CoA hydratase/isomerase [Brucella melitensis bv. 1 str. 16M]EEZ15579.1 enoyl-CoA hydratase/isomerase [Brucella melitensis bv. 1 str. Rev.1]